MSHSATSHALRLLRAHEVVQVRRAGRMAYYELADDHVRELIGSALEHQEHAQMTHPERLTSSTDVAHPAVRPSTDHPRHRAIRRRPTGAGCRRRWSSSSRSWSAEIVVGLLAHSLALITDAGHMLTDAAALAVAIIASRLIGRPAAGAYTYGFTRVDALSAQGNGITLVLLAIWFSYESVRRLIQPPNADGGPMLAVAVRRHRGQRAGGLSGLAGRPDRRRTGAIGTVTEPARRDDAFGQ